MACCPFLLFVVHVLYLVSLLSWEIDVFGYLVSDLLYVCRFWFQVGRLKILECLLYEMQLCDLFIFVSRMIGVWSRDLI